MATEETKILRFRDGADWEGWKSFVLAVRKTKERVEIEIENLKIAFKLRENLTIVYCSPFILPHLVHAHFCAFSLQTREKAFLPCPMYLL